METDDRKTTQPDGELKTGIDPEVMQAGITLAGYYIEKGARTYAAYVKAIVGELGDSVKPYLKTIYLGVKHYPGANFEGMDTEATVEKADVEAILAEKSVAEDEEIVEDESQLEGETDEQRKSRLYPLKGWGLTAMEHWKKNCPRMFRALEETEGGARKLAHEIEEEATNAYLRMVDEEKVHPQAAREIVMHDLVLSPKTDREWLSLPENEEDDEDEYEGDEDEDVWQNE